MWCDMFLWETHPQIWRRQCMDDMGCLQGPMSSADQGGIPLVIFGLDVAVVFDNVAPKRIAEQLSHRGATPAQVAAVLR